MGLYRRVIRPALFQLDAEKAHDLGMKAIRAGLLHHPAPSRPDLRRTVFGVEFAHPIGLAAGFDKDGLALNRWRDLGFAFVEVGTVTRHPQPGNPKPRMFRLPESRAIINRLGFNNRGAEALAARLEAASPGIPVGVNLGKSKVTPLEEAPDDYAWSYRRLHKLGDYFVVNVSSPNTPGLRSLQDGESLRRIVGAMKEIDDGPPILIKLAPDLTPEALDEAVDAALAMGCAGLICTNTTLDRSMLPADPDIQGGLSGEPLRTRAEEALRRAADRAAGRLVLVGVGGIMGPEDVDRRLAMGAELVQVYTGWVYGGPKWVASTVAALRRPGP
ncbi:MAG: quinone-dependent dihydroorotate dehydrogenase [Fimbriimonadaceae bacterium]|nr:quinone-dependent dihydroorotate dehydrogenase [Fimbriimonadaceae bacterium]